MKGARRDRKRQRKSLGDVAAVALEHNEAFLAAIHRTGDQPRDELVPVLRETLAVATAYADALTSVGKTNSLLPQAVALAVSAISRMLDGWTNVEHIDEVTRGQQELERASELYTRAFGGLSR